MSLYAGFLAALKTTTREAVVLLVPKGWRDPEAVAGLGDVADSALVLSAPPTENLSFRYAPHPLSTAWGG